MVERGIFKREFLNYKLFYYQECLYQMQITKKKMLGFLKHESIKRVISVPGMLLMGVIQAVV